MAKSANLDIGSIPCCSLIILSSFLYLQFTSSILGAYASLYQFISGLASLSHYHYHYQCDFLMMHIAEVHGY